MKRRVILAAATVVAIIAVAGSVLGKRYPSYNGKSVVEWVDEYSQYLHCDPDPRSFNYDPSCERSKKALLHIGTNAIPYLLGLAKAPPDSHLKLRLVGFIRRHEKVLLRTSWLKERFRGYSSLASDKLNKADRVFRLLGETAKPAVPELMDIMRNSKNKDAPAFVVSILAQLGPAAEEALPVLVENFKSPDRDLRQGTYLAIICITDDSRCDNGKRMCPELIKVLDDPNNDIASALHFLFRCCGETEKTHAANIVAKYLLHPNAETAQAARTAVNKIPSLKPQ